ncbi:hypothetical protein BHE74_00051433 [Ensete ventricosum]|nr:hypothetical protein BHE74_00051433 [Ensete ventricosum]
MNIDSFLCYMSKFDVQTKVCNFDLYRPVWTVHTGTRTARYRAVPSKIGRRQPILKEIDRRRSIEEEKGKKKRKRKKKEEGKKEYLASAILAHLPSPPAGRPWPRPRPLCLPCEETRPASSDRDRFFSRARRQIEAT